MAENNVLNMRETVSLFLVHPLRFARLKKGKVFKIA
jgi:hypothetical protein